MNIFAISLIKKRELIFIKLILKKILILVRKFTWEYIPLL